jgi:hypothetical protein
MREEFPCTGLIQLLRRAVCFFRLQAARADSLDAQTRIGTLVFGAEGMASHREIEEQLDAI